MNKVFLVGRLADAPQTRQTPNGVTVTTFRLGITRRYNRDQTDWIPVVTWRGLAENCARYLVKGQRVAVVGELQSRSYEDKDGNKRTAYEVSADDVEFLAKPGASGAEGTDEILVSVIVSVYNGDKHLRECLNDLGRRLLGGD